MTTNEILNLDYRIEENKNKIQKVLRLIKPLSKYSEEIPIEKLEKCLYTLCSKYSINLSEIDTDMTSNKFIIWKMSLTIFGKKPKYLGKVYGSCLYELLAKANVLAYSEVKKIK